MTMMVVQNIALQSTKVCSILGSVSHAIGCSTIGLRTGSIMATTSKVQNTSHAGVIDSMPIMVAKTPLEQDPDPECKRTDWKVAK